MSTKLACAEKPPERESREWDAFSQEYRVEGISLGWVVEKRVGTIAEERKKTKEKEQKKPKVNY